MNVKLISVTQPMIEGEQMSAEELITYCARVSNPENQMNTETAPRLINFLIKHKHWSPFEMVNMCVEIKTSRAIAAQILRHRSFSFQEFSQRYSQAPELEPLELREQAESNRQSSSNEIKDEQVKATAQLFMESAQDYYRQLCAMGVARETARMILPLGVQTTMYMSGTVRSWVHYINLRTEGNTQKEHRDVAKEIKKIFIQQFPQISEALGWTKCAEL